MEGGGKGSNEMPLAFLHGFQEVKRIDLSQHGLSYDATSNGSVSFLLSYFSPSGPLNLMYSFGCCACLQGCYAYLVSDFLAYSTSFFSKITPTRL